MAELFTVLLAWLGAWAMIGAWVIAWLLIGAAAGLAWVLAMTSPAPSDVTQDTPPE